MKRGFDAEEEATALMSSPSAAGQADFAARAAAAFALAGIGAPGVDLMALWPGRLEDFRADKRHQNLAIARALLALAAR